ncbi:RNA polymerase sigma-70 factor [Mangrovibacterium diazotrophicum]|uniref:RNA polymerase sigma-70 factor (ECF subfamily) n=1 Tax=Mangrovibacterium diazotrophicum TaxID=1261403 RepID=A0A419W571_9BACT|nr:RNA polymerase sigma-70 factor [Mangrovibacterium diazotrophicum]RKD90621.1 RNA polymerase sigma-70 factor (ECF subfamily) [Mangrovibacterium diazotrophicum]
MNKIFNTKGNQDSQLDWNEENFSSLFDQYYEALCFFADKYLDDLDMSRSVVQDVFVSIWTKRENISPKFSIKSYLYFAVRNRALDHLRRNKRNVEFSEGVENNLLVPFDDRVEEAEITARVNKSINELPERCREVFILCRFEGLKYSQCAEQLNISVKTVESQMAIALKRLREKLADYQYFNVLIGFFLKKN